jgi:hypothetical protein
MPTLRIARDTIYGGRLADLGGRISRGREGNPYAGILEEAERAESSWAPVASGLFAGLTDRFKEVAVAYNNKLLSKLQWF